MSGKGADLLSRHNEIRSALSFVLGQWYKHKQAGTSIDSRQVLSDFVRFRSLESVIERIKASHPQVQAPGGGRGKMS